MKDDIYESMLESLSSMCDGESDHITVMSTISCEIFHAWDYVNWAGFYRLVDKSTIKVGPYQGGHGCLSIATDRGVCGKCVRERKVQIVTNVEELPYHIACSSQTRSEIAVPVLDSEGTLRAVLDVDSTELGSFDDVDANHLQQIAKLIYK